MSDLNSILAAAIAAASNGAMLMGQMFHLPPEQLKEVFKAQDGDTAVTIIDRRVGEMIDGILTDLRPNDTIHNEDAAGQQGSSGVVWYVDPLDGTANVNPLHLGESVVGVVAERDGEAIAVAIGNPFEGTITFGSKGQGAFVAAISDLGKIRRLMVDKDKPYRQRVLLIDSNFCSKAATHKLAFLQALTNPDHPGACQHVRSLGSNIRYAELMAQGRAHVQLTDTVGGHWDVAPAILLVKEAGGDVFDIDGNIPRADKYHVAVATNGEFRLEILTALKSFYRDYNGFR